MKIALAKTDAARAACFAIRRAVFIEEQAIPEDEEWDAIDDHARHVLAEDANGPAGTARVYVKDGEARIGRVAVMPAFRGTGLGARILDVALAEARTLGTTSAALDAQTYAEAFYARFGFVAEGPEFDDGSGILHRRMVLPLV